MQNGDRIRPIKWHCCRSESGNIDSVEHQFGTKAKSILAFLLNVTRYRGVGRPLGNRLVSQNVWPRLMERVE